MGKRLDGHRFYYVLIVHQGGFDPPGENSTSPEIIRPH